MADQCQNLIIEKTTFKVVVHVDKMIWFVYRSAYLSLQTLSGDLGIRVVSKSYQAAQNSEKPFFSLLQYA